MFQVIFTNKVAQVTSIDCSDDDPESFGVTRVSKSCGTNHSIPNLTKGFTMAEAAYVEGNLYICGGFNDVRKKTVCK